MHPAASKFRRGFTLIEIMVVVAIMGLIMAMGVPSILANMKKEGMRKAISDLSDACQHAREQAIMQNLPVAVEFHPVAKTFGSYALPDGVEWLTMDINQMDFLESDVARVWFYQDGTSDELRIVLDNKGQLRKLTLEFSTGILDITDVDK